MQGIAARWQQGYGMPMMQSGGGTRLGGHAQHARPPCNKPGDYYPMQDGSALRRAGPGGEET